MAVDDSFNKQFFSNYIWRKLRDYKNNKDITFEELAKKVWVTHPYLVNMFNGRQTASSERWESVAIALWLSKLDFDKIYQEARGAEFEHSTGIKVRADRDMDYDELFELVQDNMKLTDEQVKAVKEFIAFQKARAKD